MKRILVVDDEMDLLLAIGVLLQSAGYEVVETSTGQEGIEAAEREDPDVVVLDIGLPDISGVEVLRHLRAAGNRAKIVILSAHASGHTEATATAEGADGYLTKPFNPEELLQMLERVLA
ncbi:MAG: response regulator [Actinomycetota bacterium]|nr:response regulator [Actinomycetota bacterium]